MFANFCKSHQLTWWRLYALRFTNYNIRCHSFVSFLHLLWDAFWFSWLSVVVYTRDDARLGFDAMPCISWLYGVCVSSYSFPGAACASSFYLFPGSTFFIWSLQHAIHTAYIAMIFQISILNKKQQCIWSNRPCFRIDISSEWVYGT